MYLLSLHFRQFLERGIRELIGRYQTCLSVAELDVATLVIPKPVIARDSEPVSAISLPCDPSPLFRYGSSIVRGSNSGREKKVFSSVGLPGRLWGPSILQFSVYRSCSGQGAKLTSDLSLMLRSRIIGAIPLLPLYTFTPRTVTASFTVFYFTLPHVTLLYFTLR
jgi:hypothetical protein